MLYEGESGADKKSDLHPKMMWTSEREKKTILLNTKKKLNKNSIF